MNKTITLTDEEIETLKKINNFLTDEEIDRFFPKFKDILIKVNNG
jgi:FtsZ-binding cell division protein ZapB